MEEDEIEAAAQAATKKSASEKKWKKNDLDTYRNVVGALVHFNVKTVNSNANAAGIRIAKEVALNLPYVSARTLAGTGVQLELDYAKGGAASSGVVSQIYGVIANENFAHEATEEERRTILHAMEDAIENAYAFGIESVDSRLRQLLIPHPDAERGYVAVTPTTSNGLCHYLTHNQTGLVSLHNAKTSDDAKKARDSNTSRQLRRIRQARFGIGGANTQNIGRLISSSMHSPIFVQGPQPLSASQRRVFYIYRHGITIDFNRFGNLRSELFEYFLFLKKVQYLLEKPHDKDSGFAKIKSRLTTGAQKREEDEAYMEKICKIILDMGDEAYDALSENLHQIPELKTLSDEERSKPDKWLSRTVPNTIRGLIIPELRKEGNWPHDMASFIVERMRRAVIKREREEEDMLRLDAPARSHLVAILRNILARKVPQ